MKKAIYFIADNVTNCIVSDFYPSKEELLAKNTVDINEQIVKVPEGTEDYEQLKPWIEDKL